MRNKGRYEALVSLGFKVKGGYNGSPIDSDRLAVGGAGGETERPGR